MWCRLTFVKFDPNKLDEGRRLFEEVGIPVIKTQKGNIDVLLLESANELGEAIALTSWETKEDADAYESSGTYRELVSKIIHTHVRQPMLKQYEVKHKR